MGRPRLTGWEPAFLAALDAGATVGEAAAKAGVSPATVDKKRWESPEFAARVAEASPRLRAAARRAGPRTFGADAAARVLDGLRRGLTLKRACEAAGVHRQTVMRVRRIDDEFDEAVVAAAAEGGGSAVSRLPRLACPGEWCGTATGYDYGCSRDPCRAAVTKREAARRRRRVQR